MSIGIGFDREETQSNGPTPAAPPTPVKLIRTGSPAPTAQRSEQSEVKSMQPQTLVKENEYFKSLSVGRGTSFVSPTKASFEIKEYAKNLPKMFKISSMDSRGHVEFKQLESEKSVNRTGNGDMYFDIPGPGIYKASGVLLTQGRTTTVFVEVTEKGVRELDLDDKKDYESTMKKHLPADYAKVVAANEVRKAAKDEAVGLMKHIESERAHYVETTIGNCKLVPRFDEKNTEENAVNMVLQKKTTDLENWKKNLEQFCQPSSWSVYHKKLPHEEREPGYLLCNFKAKERADSMLARASEADNLIKEIKESQSKHSEKTVDEYKIVPVFKHSNEKPREIYEWENVCEMIDLKSCGNKSSYEAELKRLIEPRWLIVDQRGYAIEYYATKEEAELSIPDRKEKKNAQLRESFFVEKVKNNYVLSFNYDKQVVEAVKLLPGRKYDPNTKSWSVPVKQKSELEKLIKDFGFSAAIPE
ncbi:MAG: hypothetical protein ACYDBP_07165 [Leptospirales bacterium]